MTRSNLGRTVAAIFCTVVMSATCVLGAVGPAEAGAMKAAPVAATRLVA